MKESVQMGFAVDQGEQHPSHLIVILQNYFHINRQSASFAEFTISHIVMVMRIAILLSPGQFKPTRVADYIHRGSSMSNCSPGRG